MTGLTPSDDERQLILGAMRRWLDGEPVPSFADILSKWGDEFENYRRRRTRGKMGIGDIERMTNLFTLREEAVSAFGFAIPCTELIAAMKEAAPLVEIGAGTGYMTALARLAGIDIIGSDSHHGGYGFEIAAYDPQQITLAGKTAVRRFRDRTVFCSWPSLYETWFRQALRAMRIGQKLIVIREDACAEDSTWDYLDACFIHEQHIEIPTWPHMHDYAEVWRKRRQR